MQEWLLWAAKNGIDERVIKFISQNDDFLDGDGKETDYTGLEKSPDRRGWEKVSCVIKGNLNLDFTDKKMISGIVGVKAANLFFESFGKSKILSAEKLLLNDVEFNPKITKNISDFELSEYLKVEMFRAVLKHPYQRQPVNPKFSALACASDVTISDSCKINVPIEKPAYRNLPEGKSFEEYYAILKYMINEPQKSSESENSNDENDGNFENDENKPSKSSQNDETWKEFNAENYAEKSALWEEDEEASETMNCLILKTMETNQWGNIPEKIKETIIASRIIPMDYKTILRSFRASILSSERKLTRMKPNRRYGFEFMGSKADFKSRILVAVDTSGSISDDDLKNFFSIINRFFKYGIKEIDVVQFDCELSEPVTLKRAFKEIKVTGRGGTDFMPALDFYFSHSEYDGLIMFTDGYAAIPEIKTNRRILWIFTGKQQYEEAQRWIKNLPLSKSTYVPCGKMDF